MLRKDTPAMSEARTPNGAPRRSWGLLSSGEWGCSRSSIWYHCYGDGVWKM